MGEMKATQGTIHEGLEGVVVTATKLGDVDGERGRLVVRGHDIERLAPEATSEAMLALLHEGALPTADAMESLRARLGAARVAAHARLLGLGDALSAADAMDALRAGLSHHGSAGDEADAVQLAGAAVVYVAAWARKKDGLPPLPPDPSLSQAADLLRLLHGDTARVSPALVRGLDTYLSTVADHGMNASTFTARVVTSTGSDMVSAVVAAIGALKGPLHGGAPGPVLDMLDAIGRPEDAEDWLAKELSQGRRIMGMGHRIYRVRDPRAAVLERAVEALERAGVTTGRLALARSVERAARDALLRRHPDRPLHANVEFYTAVLLDTLGLPRAIFPAVFAIGRIAGWTAHVREQRAEGRLIRPQSLYVGPAPRA
jgi:citrate synthase